jgi:hypothetical protein
MGLTYKIDSIRETETHSLDFTLLPHFVLQGEKILLYLNQKRRSRDSVVYLETSYGFNGPGFEALQISLLHNRRDRQWHPPSLIFNGYRFTFPREKRPGRDTDL